MAPQIITLMTDFGTRDGFVAAMKGVMLDICPNVTLVDVSHEAPPHDIAHAAFVLGATYTYFSQGTIHLAVVDPGVGSPRHPLLLVTPNGYFVGPDNGIFSYVIGFGAISTAHQNDEFMAPVKVPVPDGCKAFVLNRADYWLKQVSSTFHGRDIFAPVAAHLASGVSPSSLGQAIDEVTYLNVPQPVRRDASIRGNVIFVDHFGNLVSNIRMADVGERDVEISIAGRTILGLSQSYYNATSGLLAIIGSHGYLEIAVREGSASEYLDARVGAPIEIHLP